MQKELRTRYIVDISYGSLRTLLLHLGFKFKKDDNRRALMEKTNIAAKRSEFFRKYKDNKNSPFQRELVFLDETWIFSKGSQIKSWQDDSTKSVRKPGGFDGKRFIVLHAGNSRGFINNASLLFASKSKMLDYHGEMNSDLFTKWVKEKLIPNLEEPSLIIMDNAAYHSVEIEKQPCTSWKKCEIQEWLQKNNILYNNAMLKMELLQLAKLHKKEIRYVIDELLREHGHEVLRLPPYHCTFNAIEMIWADTKTYYNQHMGEDGYGNEKVEEMWQRALEKCTPEVWKAKVMHTENIIEEWMNRERLIENIPPLIIEVNNNESDTETDISD